MDKREIDERLLEQLREQLTARAARVTRCRADAEDCVQSAIMRVFERQSSLPPNANISAWLKVVVHRLAIDRARQRKREHYLRDHVEDHAVDSEEQLPLWRCVSREQLTAALDACGPKLRQAYLLHCEQGLSYREIAQALDIPLRTAGSRIHRARAMLREHLVNSMTGN